MRGLLTPQAPCTDVLSHLPTRTPAEVCAQLIRIARTTGGWIHGDSERYWLLSWCHTLTITGWKTAQDADREASLLHTLTCGPYCRQWHAVLDMETLSYVGPSLLTAFCQSLPSTLNVQVPSPMILRMPKSRGRSVLVAGLKRHGPQLDFWPGPIYWRIEWSDGTYHSCGFWDTLIDESGIEAFMQWFFYEITSQPHWQHPAMSLGGGEVWSKCPRAVAVQLIPALHTFLTDLVHRIEHVKRQHPEMAYALYEELGAV